MNKITNLFKSLLVVAMLGIGSNAWATLQTIKSWDFTSQAVNASISSADNGTVKLSVGSRKNITCNLSHTGISTEGLYFWDSWKLYASYLQNVSGGDRIMVIPSLKASDIITFKSDASCIIASSNSSYTDYDSGTGTYTITVTSDGNVGLGINKQKNIYQITVQRDIEEGTCEDPTYTISGAVNNNRKFTLACETENSTIYYSETELVAGADGWVEYTGEVTTSATTIYAYAKTDAANSNVINFSTGAGTTITLNAPTITLSGVTAIANVYYPVVTITNDQTDIEVVPASTTLSYEFNDAAISASSPYAFTETGELTVTVSADGYTSNSASYIVNTGYVKTGTIDLAAITESELSAVWTKTSDASQLPAANWISRYSSAEYPLYVYDYKNASANKNEVIDGLVVNISSKDADPGVTPTFYVGAGMILPTKKLNASDLSESSTWNSSIGVGIAGGTSDQIVVYTYPTDYGKSTNISAIAGNTNFNLYRYSDMLTKVEVYSPYTSMSIVGDFSPNEWDAANGIEMTRDTEDPHIWTAVVEDFVVTSEKYNYSYKATANGTWGVYELGEDDNSSQNQTYNFDYDGAREGKYTLTFTVNTSTNRVSLAIEKQHTYTVVGCYNNDDTPSFFGTAWAATLEDNDMTDNGDGTYSKSFNNVTLEVGTIWYKVVEDHAWTNNWGFNPSVNGGNADYYVGTAGTYHITFTFNPNADGYKVSCSLIPATVSKTITSAGWATYCSPYALDFTNAIANLDAAYIVTGGADGVLEMTEVTGIVPANTGLLLKGEGDVAIPVASSDANVDVSANKLEGVTANTEIDAETGYVLMASPSLGFYKNSNDFTVGANTAYLPADFDVTSARFFLLDGGKTTSISEQFLDEPSGKAERTVNSEKLVYDLQGRRVNSSLKPGLYIMSGKKVVIK